MYEHIYCGNCCVVIDISIQGRRKWKGCAEPCELVNKFIDRIFVWLEVLEFL